MIRASASASAFNPAHFGAELVIRVRELIANRRHRAAVRDLMGCEDRLLKDIGLTRSDVIAALDSPLDRDPSVHLRRMAFKHRRI